MSLKKKEKSIHARAQALAIILLCRGKKQLRRVAVLCFQSSSSKKKTFVQYQGSRCFITTMPTSPWAIKEEVPSWWVSVLSHWCIQCAKCVLWFGRKPACISNQMPGRRLRCCWLKEYEISSFLVENAASYLQKKKKKTFQHVGCAALLHLISRLQVQTGFRATSYTLSMPKQ